jgi:two-component system sensor histidine kinase ChiS
MVHIDDLLGTNPGRVDFFLSGFVVALLCLTVVPVFRPLAVFRKEGARSIHGVRTAAAAVLCFILGICLALLPVSDWDVLLAGSHIQSLGRIGFEIALFSSVFLPDHTPGFSRIILGSLALVGFLGLLLPLGLPLRSAHALGGFSFFTALLSLIFALFFQRRRYRNYLLAGVELLFLTASLFIPFSMPQILILAAVMVFSFSSGSLFVPRKETIPRSGAGNGDDLIQKGEWEDFPAGEEPEEEETILPDKIDPVSHAINPFIPREFLEILNKETVMDLQLGDHTEQEMTIFFSDIRQFTDLSENLTPEESFKFINSYLSRIVPEITEKGGFVDKYIGDAILALYPQTSGADMAVRTAIAIQKRILEYNIHRASCGYRPLAMGIGIHTGTLMLGVVGVEGRMQNTVISDAVNLASRLESITKFFNISMAISEQTFKKLVDPGAYMYRFIGKVRVKGKSEPVSVFEIFDGIKSDVMERKMKANMYFEQGMLSYYQKEFGEALINFRKVLEILPEDGASLFYMQNCLAKIKIARL